MHLPPIHIQYSISSARIFKWLKIPDALSPEISKNTPKKILIPECLTTYQFGIVWRSLSLQQQNRDPDPTQNRSGGSGSKVQNCSGGSGSEHRTVLVDPDPKYRTVLVDPDPKYRTVLVDPDPNTELFWRSRIRTQNCSGRTGSEHKTVQVDPDPNTKPFWWIRIQILQKMAIRP